MNLHEWISTRVAAVERLAQEAREGAWTAAEGEASTAATALRRCEADRRILARHKLNPNAWWQEAAMCDGCGWQGDPECPVTDNLNDCPELLDLAYAHGIAADELAALDRPTPAPRPPDPPARPHPVVARMTAAEAPETFRPGTAR